jgi:hypothetical protein
MALNVLIKRTLRLTDSFPGLSLSQSCPLEPRAEGEHLPPLAKSVPNSHKWGKLFRLGSRTNFERHALVLTVAPGRPKTRKGV